MTLFDVRHALQHALPTWVTDRFVQLVALACLMCTMGFCAVLVWAPRSEFRSPLWADARSVLPLETWGLLGLVFVGVAVLLWWVQGRCALGAFWSIYVLGTGYWGFWTILTASASIGPNGSTGILSIFCGTLAVFHVLVGLAWLPSRRRLPAKRA